MAKSREENPVLVDQFVAVTGATRAVAVSMLEACAGNLDLAVGMHMDGQGAAGSSSSPLEEGAVAASGAGPFDLENSDEVRAPIPQKTEVLVEDDGYKSASWRMKRPRRMVRSVFDGFRDFQAEARNYEDGVQGKSSSKKRNLEDLFRPPVDITHKGTFQSARDLGSMKNQWLLVNVQNVQEFECQVLNRDVWSCQVAKKLVSSSFIFWQVYNDSAEGKRFMQFYKVSQWPYVSIMDPFTGEVQIVWHKIPDGTTFVELANEFLGMHPTPNKCDSESPSAKRAKLESSIVDASEQDQMEAAIQASLEQTKPKSPLYVIDSDSEPDLISDSDGVETFSDSDNVIESSPVTREKSPAKSKKLKMQSSKSNQTSLSSFFTSSSSSPSSSLSPSSSASSLQCSSYTNKHTTESSSRKTVKDISSKCKNLSTSTKTTCSYTPLSHDSSFRNCGESITSSRLWEPAVRASVIDSPLSSSMDNSLPDTPIGRDGELCTLSNSPSGSQTSDMVGQTDATSSESLDWKHYWGDTNDPMNKIMMRFPDSRREQVELPCSSSLRALKVYCASLGFPEDKYELVTNFPQRKLSQMEESKTLKDAGLHPQDTVFIQDI